MDHAINSLRQFLEIEIDSVTEQWCSGRYAKLTECPNYRYLKALVDAIHVLEKSYYGKKVTMSVRDLVML